MQAEKSLSGYLRFLGVTSEGDDEIIKNPVRGAGFIMNKVQLSMIFIVI